jgi:hypothetical protein
VLDFLPACQGQGLFEEPDELMEFLKLRLTLHHVFGVVVINGVPVKSFLTVEESDSDVGYDW